MLSDATRASLAEHGNQPEMEETCGILEFVLMLHEEDISPTPPQPLLALAAGSPKWRLPRREERQVIPR